MAEMLEVREVLSNLANLNEEQLKGVMEGGSSPDVVFAALLTIFDGYPEAAECDWLHDFAEIAIERVFALVAAASGEDELKIKSLLYRATVQQVASRQHEIYAHEEKNPFLPTEQWSWPQINWPETDTTPNKRKTSPLFMPFSALKMFGYTVGKHEGWPKPKRMRFLSDFMESDLPSCVTRHFGSDYGRPLTTTRLRKVANVISSNCSSRLRNNPVRYKQAISDWIEDLEFLKSKYFDGHGLKFVPWPDPRG